MSGFKDHTVLWFSVTCWSGSLTTACRDTPLLSHHQISYSPHGCSSSFSNGITDRWLPITCLPSLQGKSVFWSLDAVGHVLYAVWPLGSRATVLRAVLFCSSASWPIPSPAARATNEISLGAGQRWDELFWQWWFGPKYSARFLMCFPS